MMQTALVIARRTKPLRGGLRKVVVSALRCRLNQAPILPTFLPAKVRARSRRRAMSRENVRALVEAAKDVKNEAPRPLMRELPPADPFPVEVLGPMLAPATRA